MVFRSKVSATIKRTPPLKLSVKYFSTRKIDEPLPYSSIPQPKWSIPFVGTAWHYRLGVYSINDMLRTRRGLFERYGPLVREKIHGETVLHVFDLEDIRTVFNSEHRLPLIEPLLPVVKQYRELRDYPAGIGGTNGEEWYRLRSAVNRLMMRPTSVVNFLDFQQEVIDDWIETLKSKYITKSGSVPTMETQLNKWNFETAAYNVLNKRFNLLENDDPNCEMLKLIGINGLMFQRAVTFQYGWLPWQRWFTTPEWRKFMEAEDFFYGTINRYLSEGLDELNNYMEDINSGKVQNGDDKKFLFLRHAVSSEKLSLSEIKSTALSLFTDGFSTTVPTAVYMLDQLARYPDCQDNLYKEISEVVGPKSTDRLTAEHMNQLPLVKAFLKETFRFFPIQPGISRVTNTDLILSGYKIPSGTSVFLENGVHLRDSKQFDKPDEFVPERWLRNSKSESELDRGNRSAHPFVLIPFSHGTRMCLGRRFAEQELHLLLVKILQQFKLRNNLDRPMGLRFQILNIPDSPLRISLIPRN